MHANGKTKTLMNPNWPEATWNLCGVFASDAQLLLLHDYLGARQLPLVARIHGAPPCLWSGARVAGPLEIIAKIEMILHQYAQKRLAVTLDFTGAQAGSHLDDNIGNFILGCLAHYNAGGNGVCVCDEALATHVRQRHPQLKLIASHARADHTGGQGQLDYYRSLEDRYDLIQIHPDDNLNLELLSQLDNRQRYEITVNDPCIRHCPDRKAHHQADSDHYLNFLDGRPVRQGLELILRNGCENFHNLLLSEEKRTLVLSVNELRQIYDLGFRHFRIDDSGAANDASRLVQTLPWLLSDDPDQDHLTARLVLDMLSK